MGLKAALGLRDWRPSARAAKRPHKFGVLRFGYEDFSALHGKLQSVGTYDVNLGDNAQSIAVRNVFRELEIDDDQIISINRDTLSSYCGPPCSLVMNAIFYRQSFPLPAHVRPIFIGFQAGADVIRDNRDLLKKHEPIGCRDTATTERIRMCGIQAFTTGCITLSLPARVKKPEDGRVFIVYGTEFPSAVLQHIPPELSSRCELVYHRFPVDEFPVSSRTCRTAEAYEKSLLDRYRHSAKLVITPLHHVAAPCMAMGIPVIICRPSYDDRFSFLKDFTPIYTPENFDSIDWNPAAVDVSAVRNRLKRLVAEATDAHRRI